MTDINQTLQTPAPSVPHPGPDDACKLSPQNAASLLRNLRGARAMLRAVIVAQAAVSDGNWAADDSGPERWSPVLDQVRERLVAVRDILISTVEDPAINWTGCLLLAEALDAALWHSCSGGADVLDEDELVCAAEELVSMLDKALAVCLTEGVPARAAVH